ncbi:uncharacterized protein [Littorina saxatilis]
MKGGKPVMAKEQQIYVHQAYNAPFDNVQFITAKAANFKPNSFDPSGYPNTQHPMDDSTASSIPETNESDTSGTSPSQSEERRGHVFRVFLGVFGCLTVLAVVGVAVYSKLAKDDIEGTRSRRYASEMSMTVTNQQFSEEFLNQSSPDFADFQTSFCSNMTVIFSKTTALGNYRGCSVVDLRNGSVVVDFTLYFIGTTAPSVVDIFTSLTKGSNSSVEGTITLTTGLEIAEKSVQVLKIVGDVPIDQFVVNVPVPPQPVARPTTTTDVPTTRITSLGENINSTSNTTDPTRDLFNTTDEGSTTTEPSFATDNGTTGSTNDANATQTSGSNSTEDPGRLTEDSSNSTDLSTDLPEDVTNSTTTSVENENSTVSSTTTTADSVNSSDNSTSPDPNEVSNYTTESTSNSTDDATTNSATSYISTTEPGDGFNSTNSSTQTSTDGLDNSQRTPDLESSNSTAENLNTTVHANNFSTPTPISSTTATSSSSSSTSSPPTDTNA